MLRFALAAALAISLVACDDPKSEREALSNTATVLPPGVRQQWFAALDQAMKEQLSIYIRSGANSGIFGRRDLCPDRRLTG